jgi:ribosomal protein L24E
LGEFITDGLMDIDDGEDGLMMVINDGGLMDIDDGFVMKDGSMVIFCIKDVIWYTEHRILWCHNVAGTIPK